MARFSVWFSREHAIVAAGPHVVAAGTQVRSFFSPAAAEPSRAAACGPTPLALPRPPRGPLAAERAHVALAPPRPSGVARPWLVVPANVAPTASVTAEATQPAARRTATRQSPVQRRPHPRCAPQT